MNARTAAKVMTSRLDLGLAADAGAGLPPTVWARTRSAMSAS